MSNRKVRDCGGGMAVLPIGVPRGCGECWWACGYDARVWFSWTLPDRTTCRPRPRRNCHPIDVSYSERSAVAQLGVGSSIAIADVDQDGSLDVVLLGRLKLSFYLAAGKHVPSAPSLPGCRVSLLLQFGTCGGRFQSRWRTGFISLTQCCVEVLLNTGAKW